MACAYHLRLGVIAGLLIVSPTLAASPQDLPTFRAGNDLVRVFATVTDSAGRLVTGLGREAFEIRDEGKVQPIEVFDDTPVPIKVVTLLDVSGSMAGNVQLVRRAAEELFNRLGPDDLARVGFFGGEVIKFGPTFTRDAEALRATLPKDADASGLTPLWVATDAALRLLGETPTAHRKVVLILSDGKNMVENRQLSVTADQVMEHAGRTDAMVYGIGLRSRQSNRYVTPGSFRTSLEDDLPDPALARLAAETGGGYTEVSRRDDLPDEFARVMAELHSQYLLGFSASARDGKVHELDVRVLKRGMKSRARKTYLAPAPQRG